MLALHRSLFGDGGVALPDAGDDRAAGPIRVRVTELMLPGAGRDLQAAVTARSPAAARELPPADPVLFSLGGGGLEAQLVDSAPTARRLSALGAARDPGRARGARRRGLACPDAPYRAAARRAGDRAGGRDHRRGHLDRPRRWCSRASTRRHGDAVVGHDLERVPGRSAAVGAGRRGRVGVIAAAAIEPGAPGAWRRMLAGRDDGPRGSMTRLARAIGLVALAVLLVWMPEVPLDLAVVVAAGLLVFSGAAEVVRLAQRSLIR